MQSEKFKEILFKKAKKVGFDDCEIYYSQIKSFSVNVYKGEIEKYQNNEFSGLSFRGMYNGKIGYSYTENISEDVIDFIIESAKENATVLNSQDEEFIYEGDKNYPIVKSYNEELEKITPNQKINAALEMEKAVLNYSNKIQSCQRSTVSSASGMSYIANTKGLNLEQKTNYVFAYASAIAKEGEQVKSNSEFWGGFDFNDFNPKKIGENAAKKAVEELGANSIESGTKNIIFLNDAFSDILGTFCSSFYAENVQKGFSLLKDKLNNQIASDIITIYDNPLMENGYSSTSFDSEGVASKNKIVVDKGILKTYLYNLKSATIDKTTSTGNGFRSSFKSSVSTSATNFYIENGKNSIEKIFDIAKDGIFITSLAGLHSGANSVSGDFSFAASGYLIENGKRTTPVEQITVSGNFFTILKNISAIADDLKFQINGIGSPSVFIKNMEVAGD